MNGPSLKPPAGRAVRLYRAGYSLIELSVSMAITSVLVVTMGSAVVLSTRAIPGGANPGTASLESGRGAGEIARELRYTLSVIERTAKAIEFTVADRDHDAVAETIRYEWSGTAGDPLTRTYNGGQPFNVVQDVQEFDLSYAIQPIEPSPRVLFVVPDAGNLSPQDAAKETLIQSWGYPVTRITVASSQASFDAAVMGVSVAYISAELYSPQLGTKLASAAIGVVNEERGLADEFGFQSNSYGTTSKTQIEILDNTHEITSGYPIADLTICASNTALIKLTGTLGAGARKLAETQGVSMDPVLVVIDVGDALYGGGTAAGRRVQLPWGGNNFDFNLLNTDGLTLMERAIEWAADSSALTSARIVLHTGPDLTGRVETQVRLLNKPVVPGT